MNAMPDRSIVRRPVRRRGVAMLLVLISVMMATILTTAYLASRDNSSAIGANAAASAAARWTADSALEMGVAILQTESTWRTSHVGGRLVSNKPLAGGTFNIDLLDLKTSMPPTSSTEYVRMTATGVVDGVSQVAVAECHVPLAAGEQVDVDLSEFAVFAAQRLAMSEYATVARWPMAPLTALGARVRVGTQATSSASITLGGDAASVDTTVYHGPGASGTLVTVSNSQPPERRGVLDVIPMPGSPSPGVDPPLLVSLSPNLTQTSGNAITTTSTRWKNVSLSNGAVRMLRGNITAITDEDLIVTTNAKLMIDGNVKLVVFGDVRIDTGAIELRPGARLTMFVRGRTSTAVDLKDGYIGELRSTAVRDASGTAAYMDPERMLIFSIPGGDPASTWTMRDNTVVKASIYAPDATAMTIRDTSAVYGRVASRQLTMSHNGSVFYDPALDRRAGYTNLDSAVYDPLKYIKPEIKTLASLDATLLQPLADTLGTTVLAVTAPDSKHEPSAISPSDPVVIAPTDPTPRPVRVEAKYIVFGNSVASWEQ